MNQEYNSNSSESAAKFSFGPEKQIDPLREPSANPGNEGANERPYLEDPSAGHMEISTRDLENAKREFSSLQTVLENVDTLQQAEKFINIFNSKVEGRVIAEGKFLDNKVLYIDNKYYSLDLNSENVLELKQIRDGFSIGEKVTIFRQKSGEADANWEVIEINGHNFKLKKPYANTFFEETVSATDLYNWNPRQ
jgi:hypothetical protein